MSEANKQMIRWLLNAIWNEGRIDLIDLYFSSDYLGHFSDVSHKRKGIKQFNKPIRKDSNGFHSCITDQIAESDRVAFRWKIKAEFEGRILQSQAEQANLSLFGVDIVRITGGKIIEGWTSIVHPTLITVSHPTSYSS